MSDDNKEGARVPMCRDCADFGPICPNSGKPCAPPAVMPAAPSDAVKGHSMETDQPPALSVLHPQTSALVRRFSVALAEKLLAAEVKYGYSDGWLSPDWMDECRAKLQEHVAKGDPRDVAAYCAFLWHHGEKTFVPTKADPYEALMNEVMACGGEVTPSDADTLDVCTDSDNCNRCKTAMCHRGNLDHAGIPVGNSYGAAPTEYDRLKQQKDTILKRQADAQFGAVLALAQRYTEQAANIWRTFVPHSQGDFIELREFRAMLQNAALSQTMQAEPAAGEQAGAVAHILQFAPKLPGVSSAEPTLERIIWRYYLAHIDNKQEAQNYAATYVDALRTALAAPGAAIAAREQEAAYIDEIKFVEIANRHLLGDMDPHNAWLFFQEASRTFFGKEIA